MSKQSNHHTPLIITPSTLRHVDSLINLMLNQDRQGTFVIGEPGQNSKHEIVVRYDMLNSTASLVSMEHHPNLTTHFSFNSDSMFNHFYQAVSYIAKWELLLLLDKMNDPHISAIIRKNHFDIHHHPYKLTQQAINSTFSLIIQACRPKPFTVGFLNQSTQMTPVKELIAQLLNKTDFNTIRSINQVHRMVHSLLPSLEV